MPNERVRFIVKLLVFALVFIVAGASLRHFMQPSPVSATVAVESRPAAAVRLAPKVSVKMKSPIKAYKPDTKAKLRLPDAVIADNDKQVLAATTIRSSERPQTVTTVIDAGTGDSKTYVKSEPLPWVATESRGEVRIDYAYKFRASPVPTPVVRLTLRHDVIQVKGFHLGLNATVDTDRDAFIGVGVGYRW